MHDWKKTSTELTHGILRWSAEPNDNDAGLDHPQKGFFAKPLALSLSKRLCI